MNFRENFRQQSPNSAVAWLQAQVVKGGAAGINLKRAGVKNMLNISFRPEHIHNSHTHHVGYCISLFRYVNDVIVVLEY